MRDRRPTCPRARRAQRAALGRLLCRLARRLGLDAGDLATYAEAAYGCPLHHLSQGELLLVLEGLGELAACRAELRRQRQAHREGRRG